MQVSNGDGLIGFLRISCRHDFRNQGRKLDVDAQTDTVLRAAANILQTVTNGNGSGK